jgi:GntR family transcriptional regulator/MocR family aminotransferase
MRELYAERLAALLEGGRRHLEGLMDISSIRAGLYTAAFLRNGMTSREAELAATEHEIESMGLHRFTLRRSDPRALLLGFGGFDPARIRNALARLARALEARGPHSARI